MTTGKNLRRISIKCKTRQNLCVRIVLLFISFLTLHFVIKSANQTDTQHDISQSMNYIDVIQKDIFSLTRIKQTQRGNNTSSNKKKHKSARIAEDDSHQPDSALFYRNSYSWYLSKIIKLPYKKVTTPYLLSGHPYFQPKKTNRFDMVDMELIRPRRCFEKTQIVVLTLSEPNSTAEREAIRQTWGSVATGKLWPMTDFEMNIQLLFVVGVNSKSNMDTSKSFFLDNSQLRAEALVFNDILQISTHDTYSNLTRKMVMGFKWINKNCPDIKYVIKADQDVFVNMPMVWQFLMHYGKTNAIYGFVYLNAIVHREGKWAVSESAVPLDHYPVYAAGSCYVMSADVIANILHTYFLFPYVGIEDAFLTGIVATVTNVDRYNVTGFTYWEEQTLDDCEILMNRVYTANHFNATSMKDVWRLIEIGYRRCL